MKISDFRKRSGKTQQDLANELGTTKLTIINWESNRTTMSDYEIKQYAKAVHASIEEINECIPGKGKLNKEINYSNEKNNENVTEKKTSTSNKDNDGSSLEENNKDVSYKETSDKNDNKGISSLRRRSGKTQQNLADELDTTKATISNWEKNPGFMSMDKIRQYAEAVHASLPEMIENIYGKKQKFHDYLDLKSNVDLIKIRRQINSEYKELDNLKNNLDDKNSVKTPEFKSISSTTLNSLKSIQLSSNKLKLSVVGPSDAGKSTFINNLLGEKVLPSHWTPATSMTVRIMHSSEKPDWLLNNTIIVNNEAKNLNDFNLRDKEYYDKYVKFEGGKDLISDYGEREGKKYSSQVSSNDVIVTYIDSPILNSVEIFDTPGTNAGEDKQSSIDENNSEKTRTNSDILIYMMPSNQFMRSSDYSLLLDDIQGINKRFSTSSSEKLPNLFVVASQADIIDDEKEQNSILEKGATAFSNSIPNSMLSDMDITRDDLKQRFFSMSIKNEKLSYNFNRSLERFINNSQHIILDGAREDLNTFQKKIKLIIDSKINDLNDRNFHQDELKSEMEKNKASLPKVIDGNMKNANESKDKARSCFEDADKQFQKFYNDTINKDNLIELLNKSGLGKSKDDINAFSHKVNNILVQEYKRIMEDKTKQFHESINKLLNDSQDKYDIDVNLFDFKAAFSGAVASGISIGAFASIAAGITSNLGLYLVVGQIGGLLTSAGIISSPIVATSAVAALGGPVGWAIGISAIIGLTVTGIFGLFNKNSWKPKLCNQIIKNLKEQDILSKFFDSTKKYLNDTLNGIDDSTERMIDQQRSKISLLENQLNNADNLYNEISKINSWKNKIIKFEN